MGYFSLIVIAYMTLACITSCGLECADKKTGMPQSSPTLKKAREKEVYSFELTASKSTFTLDNSLILNIQNAWVESKWKYECKDNKAVIVKDSSCQVVLDVDYIGDPAQSKYWLGNNLIGSSLRFNYSSEDTFTLALNKDTGLTTTKQLVTIDTIWLYRR